MKQREFLLTRDKDYCWITVPITLDPIYESKWFLCLVSDIEHQVGDRLYLNNTEYEIIKVCSTKTYRIKRIGWFQRFIRMIRKAIED